MKITTTKIIRELEKTFGYNVNRLTIDDRILIRDTLYIIDDILKEQKGLTIKK